MKRRTFLSLSAAGVTVLGTSWLSSCNPQNKLQQALSKPEILAHFCDENTLVDIGKTYLKQSPAEANPDKLTQLLLIDKSGVVSTTEEPAVTQLLNKKSKDDFQNDRTVIVNGWVLSVTEARQCALYSLLQ